MDVKLQNAYVEVLLDNFMAVVKQNIMFQAQLEVMKVNVQEAEETKRKIDELSERNVELQKLNNDLLDKLENATGENQTLKQSVDSKSNQINRFNDLSKEKDRLQVAVNGYMRRVKELEEQLKTSKSDSQDVLLKLNTRLEELNKYIETLELSVPASKLKKIKVGFSKNLPTEEQTVEQKESSEPEKTDLIVNSGGTF